jgi:hypothetical protein
MESQGYQNTVNMAGGFLGAFDMSGNLIEPGWVACGFESTKECEPGRSWKELAKP